MSEKAVTVRIFFKTSDGPKAEDKCYIFEPEEFERLKREFMKSVSGIGLSGAYKCEVKYYLSAQHTRGGPTELVLRFSEVAYIG